MHFLFKIKDSTINNQQSAEDPYPPPASLIEQQRAESESPLPQAVPVGHTTFAEMQNFVHNKLRKDIIGSLAGVQIIPLQQQIGNSTIIEELVSFPGFECFMNTLDMQLITAFERV